MEALEKKLGISKDTESGQNKKRRLDDDEYIEQSKEIVENVKSAVSIGIVHALRPSTSCLANFGRTALLKKKKKAKVSHSSSQATGAPGPSSGPTSKLPAESVETPEETKSILVPNLAAVGA